ncbi:hypothetical protein ACFQ14_00315 [Pseudahrensia aquimaris]|uniref:Uncharacterized protein n=1 Tax=Pseudahrensia aquimaris TaxID=744461 RepID=A0ABW3FB86_9HYPH
MTQQNLHGSQIARFLLDNGGAPPWLTVSYQIADPQSLSVSPPIILSLLLF